MEDTAKPFHLIAQGRPTASDYPGELEKKIPQPQSGLHRYSGAFLDVNGADSSILARRAGQEAVTVKLL